MKILFQKLFPKRLHKYWKKVEKNSFKENLVFPSNQIGLGFKIDN